jgi:hypothetical protein
MKLKVIYTDGNVDKAVVGLKKAEDDQFLTIEDQYGRQISIAINRIVLIKTLLDEDKWDVKK